ncbi:tRNA pseudouridine(13) synthase TruD [Halomarina oriensis]|uniref:Probable tRNA pseudouridine synthase D n=1 Tax=Halomarina oriensis TaxID=671145 RepID=A0A6B0GKQ0_9EURY|nr:tRNA pseudouridine(13) synthase TruD [Halomarina oriensis]MWG35506.1 tRNA pseudouridine(13) synthase TruD [Halomarina oriensis]
MTRPGHPVEQAVGMASYVSDAAGIGGRLRARPEDFRVRELEAVDVEPVDADPGSYGHLVFRATLHGWDTNDFASALSDRLGMSRERVSWAGTKDKRAVTTQLFSVDTDENDLPDLRNAAVEVLGRTGRPVLFGDLRGNEFELVVRDVERPERASTVAAELAAFCDADTADSNTVSGVDDSLPLATSVCVPNYFGHQRFGSKRPVTHEVGLAIVREDYEGAVVAYVGNPSEREPDSTREARRYVEETRDWQGALDRLPKRLGYERAMCHRLVEGDDSPDDFREALETAPSNLQRLFVHAAQSYLFNRICSVRLERGLPFDRPVAGDVVCFTDEEGRPDTDRLQRVDETRVRTVTRHCERGRAFVTAPLVGTETELGDGDPGELERSVLDEAGLDPADFDNPHGFESEGTRRAIRLRSDLEIESVASENALRFTFDLPSGSYATVVLREFLKADPETLA